MYILLLVFIIIFLIQCILAINGWLARRNIDKRFAYILGENIEAAKTLENYVKIYRSVNVKVDAEIAEPAFASEDFVLINRQKMYQTDLFTNFYLIFQLELSKAKYNFLRKLFIIHNFLFLAQFLFVILAFVINPNSTIMLIIAIVLELLNIGLSFFALNGFNEVLKHAFFISSDLLNLDDVEQGRAESLRNELKQTAFEYPFDMFWKIIRFLIP